jgi:photosystem II stability/assembly factor-like uncharacterized protein
MKKFLTLFLALILITTAAPATWAAPNLSGTPCKKLNVKLKSGAITYTCVKSGKKLVWKAPGQAVANTSQNSKPDIQGTGSTNYVAGWICDIAKDSKGVKDSNGVELVCVKGSDGVYAWVTRSDYEKSQAPQQSGPTGGTGPIAKQIDYSAVSGNPCLVAYEETTTSSGVVLTCGVGSDFKQFWFIGDQTPKAAPFGNENVRESMRVFPRPGINKCIMEPGQEYQYYRTGETLQVDPFNSNHLFVAVERLGIYESFDGGNTWATASTEGILFDMKKADNTVCFKEIHAFKFDPKVKNRVYILMGGTGSVSTRKWQARGSGLYVSNNGGKNWDLLTTPDMTSFIGDLEIDPTNSDVLYVGSGSVALTSTGADPKEPFVNKGIIFKSTNGGKTWTELSTGYGKNTRVYNILVDPANSQKVTAAVFQPMSGQAVDSLFAPGTGLIGGFITSADSGKTWTQLGSSDAHKLSITYVTFSHDGKGIIFSPQDLKDNKSYFSQDGGSSFTAVSQAELILPTFLPGSNSTAFAIIERKNLVGLDQFVKSTDGGRSWTQIGNTPLEMQFTISNDANKNQARPQSIIFDPQDSKIMYLSGAGGTIAKSLDQGITWKLLATWKTLPAMNVTAK